MPEPAEYRLDLPAAADSVALVRLFVATVLRVHGIDEAVVDDAKLAASELATECVLSDVGGDISVTVHTGPDAVEVRFRPVTVGTTDVGRERLDVARALFPTTSVDPTTQTAGYKIEAIST